jgi:hypothetical protein
MENVLNHPPVDDPACLSDVEYDESGKPEGKSIVEIADKLDRKFVDFYGEYGRRLVNTRREKWNRDGLWHFDLF